MFQNTHGTVVMFMVDGHLRSVSCLKQGLSQSRTLGPSRVSPRIVLPSHCSMAPRQAMSSVALATANPNGRTALALRFPAAKVTGNYEKDSEADSLREMKMDIVDAIVASDAHVVALHGVLSKRLREMHNPKGTEYFDDISTVGKLPEEWLGSWLCEVSDLRAADIINIQKFDSEAALQLFMYATQLPSKLKLPEECRAKRVMVALANHRHDLYGKRLRAFKASTGIRPTGQLHFLNKAYKMVWTEGRLTELEHISKAKVAIPAHVHIMRDFTYECGYLDSEAKVVKAPMPPMKLSSFWCKKDRLGPWEHEVIGGGKNKSISDLCAKIAVQFEEEDRARMAGVSNEDIKGKLEQQRSEQRKETMKRAQEAAMTALQAKRSKRSISLNGTASST